MVEQSDTVAEQYGHYVNLYFVQQSSLYVLLNRIRATCNLNSFVTGGCFCLFKGAFNSVSDEGIRRSSVFDLLFSSFMSKYKYRMVKGRVVPPILLSIVEHSPAHHFCPGIFD